MSDSQEEMRATALAMVEEFQTKLDTLPHHQRGSILCELLSRLLAAYSGEKRETMLSRIVSVSMETAAANDELRKQSTIN
ncbi:hypothetical protein [Rhizobium sp. 57MFTsu3.2]|uniref:hypothetical protein n=1 Tax=Rhizobium sp. 57MFTsu3.2 TaxID=1048681 RepID=UPI00146F0A98|nr:hypothetical protein [Rhizobium sp. 57MFTsu3.2]NMN73987.1 hypothetical protein [Rhizobium sp. 57MFTsu3.2]